MNKQIEKAINAIKQLYDYNVYGVEDEDVDIAVSALEKQIPKKIINISKQTDTKHNASQNVGECPSCKNNIVAYTWWKTTHCWICGQAIDWSVEE